MSNETPREIILMLTPKQIAAVSLAATMGIAYMGFDAKAKDGDEVGAALKEIGPLFADVAEVLGVFNEALGNPSSPTFANTIERVREICDE